MTGAVLQALQNAYRQIHRAEPPRYRKFDISIISQGVDFAIRSGALPNQETTLEEREQSHVQRVAAWRAIIQQQFGENVKYTPVGRPPGFTSAVDAHVREVASRMK